MSEERKKVESKPLPIAVPKKREPIIEEPIPERTKVKLDDKYVKMSLSDTAQAFKTIGDRVQKGELGIPYFTFESEKGYLYYIVLKTI